MLRLPMTGLIRNLEVVDEEIVFEVIRRDIVIRFNSLTFAWIALSGFRSTGKPLFAQAALSGFRLAGCTDFFVFIPNFCLNRPFGFSVHRDAHFCPSRPFGFSTCRVILCVVSFDYVCVRRVWQIVAVHGGQDHCTTRKDALDYKWSFVSRSPFSPGITLR